MPLIQYWRQTTPQDPAAFATLEDDLLTALPATRPRLAFMRLRPCALIGAFDDPQRALRHDFVTNRLPIVRRRTGGGSLYVDPGTLLVMLTIPTTRWAAQTFPGVIRRLGGIIVTALRTLDVNCTFTTPNDITDAGRKIGSVYAIQIGETVLVEMALLLSVDIETMLKTLRLPLEKLSAAGLLAAGARFAPLTARPTAISCGALCRAIRGTVNQHLGRPQPMDAVADPDPERYEHLGDLPPAAPEAAVSAFLKTAGGVLSLDLTLTPDGRVHNARFTGGVQCARPGDLSALAAALTGTPIDALENVVNHVPPPTDGLGIRDRDFGYLARLCSERWRLATTLGLGERARRVAIFSPRRNQGLMALLTGARTLLLPYCAKPNWCKWRSRDGCSECGRCPVGTAYRLGHIHQLQVVTITGYEHLCAVLAALKDHGEETFIGVCCTEFFLKRDHAFIEAQLGAVFIDIGGDTCYTLRAEEAAYAGRFTAQAVLDARLLAQVLALRATPAATVPL
ncbi:MAG: lipoate--protein ligase family protein [Acidiferrobacter sp.]